jgi:hypothetical protein
MRFLFHPDLARMMLTLHRVLHHAHAQANMPKRQPPTPQTIFLLFFYFYLFILFFYFLFFGNSFPKNRGGGMG